MGFENANNFHLDLNVPTESDSFNGMGNLFRSRGSIHKNVLSEKYRPHVALGTPVEKNHQRFSNQCPDEHSEDLKDQQGS